MMTVKDKIHTKVSLINTLKLFCGAVGSTMGPDGKTVIINKGEDLPHITKDGVSVAESIFFRDGYMNDIALLIKEAARKTAAEVGDGTTTSTILTNAIIQNGLEHTNVREYLDFVDKCFIQVTDFIKESTINVNESNDLLKSIINISCNGDDEITNLVLQAVDIAGKEGLLNVQEVEDPSSYVLSSGGCLIESRVFVDEIVELDAPNVLLIEGALNETHELRNVLAATRASKRPTIIVAKEFSEDVIRIIEKNRIRFPDLTTYLIEAEGFAAFRLTLLKDISKIIGGVNIYSNDGSTKDTLYGFNNFEINNVQKVILKPTSAVLMPSIDVQTEFKDTINDFKLKIKASNSDLEKKKLQKRLSKFSDIATIHIGGITQAEIREKKDRADDAVKAAAAAVTGGVLPGGGVSLINAYEYLNKYSDKSESDSRKDILKPILFAPFKTLCDNSHLDFKELITQVGEDIVFDFKNKITVNGITEGVVDPALVTINALQNSLSVAKNILNSNFYVNTYHES